MPAQVEVVFKFTKIPDEGRDGVEVVDTTSGGPGWQSDLSPFLIGPCYLYEGYTSKNMENAWQFSKVYEEDTDKKRRPSAKYWDWAVAGWKSQRAHRYPKGKGRKPLYSLWDGNELGYVQARKVIYVPLYAEAVQNTEGWNHLQHLYYSCKKLYLRDWDGWDMSSYGMKSLTEVLNNPNRKMGHAFVLKMLLTDDPALKQAEMRW